MFKKNENKKSRKCIPVTTHAYTIFRKSFQSTACSCGIPAAVSSGVFLCALLYPTKTTEPTLQCVVDIGKPILLANSTVIAAPISMVNPL